MFEKCDSWLGIICQRLSFVFPLLLVFQEGPGPAGLCGVARNAKETPGDPCPRPADLQMATLDTLCPT